MTRTAYLPFKGGSIYGKGIVKDSDNPNYKFIFECESGFIYFNSINDRQMEGIEFILTPEQLNEYTANVIKQALEVAAEKADSYIDMNEDTYVEGNIWSEVDKESILNTFEEVYQRFSIK